MNRRIKSIFIVAAAICIGLFIGKPSEAMSYNTDENNQNINAIRVEGENVTQQMLTRSPYIIVNEDSDVLLFDMGTINSSVNLLSTNWKYKTKNVYSASTGKKVATFTIQYSTKVESGRVVFDKVGVQLSFVNSYRGSYTCTKATGDVVNFKVDYNLLGVDTGSTTVSFMP